jgi:glycosyltransferase involved in cell wall biosynthesis
MMRCRTAGNHRQGSWLGRNSAAVARRVLYTHSSSLIGGGNKVLLNLFEGLDRSQFQPMSIIPETGPLETELRRLDVPYFVLDVRPGRWSGISLGWKTLRLAVKRLQYRPHIFHANDPLTYRGASQAMPCARMARVCHIHHPGETAESLKWALKSPPGLIVTPSRFMKEQVSSCLNGAGTTRVEAVWNQVDTQWFRPAPDVTELKARLGWDPQEKNVSIMAALAPHKGHACFLRMAMLVLRRLSGTTFHIVGSAKSGDGVHAAQMRGLAAELGISDRVRFWGFVTDAVARDILCASDLFVLPSREEGFGLSVAEAQACQVPVLTSAIQPLDEVVDDGRGGYLIPPEDHEQFARRAVELLEAEDARKKMGTFGRSWVLDRFSRVAHVGRMMSLYHEISAVGGGIAK